jgi:hypothetical protein
MSKLKSQRESIENKVKSLKDAKRSPEEVAKLEEQIKEIVVKEDRLKPFAVEITNFIRNYVDENIDTLSFEKFIPVYTTLVDGIENIQIREYLYGKIKEVKSNLKLEEELKTPYKEINFI